MPFESAIISIDYNDLPIRIIDRAGEPWFVMTDVCRVLGITNSRDAASRLDDDERGVGNTDTFTGAKDVTIITESGLYALILTSRKPAARAFAKWVTGTVLPSIRRTGAYVAPTATAAGVAAAASESGNLGVVRDLLTMIYERVPTMGGDACQAVASALLGHVGIPIPGPIVEKTWTMTEIAKQFGISAISAGKRCTHLRHDGHGNLTYTMPGHGKKLVEQFRWNVPGRAACEAVLSGLSAPAIQH